MVSVARGSINDSLTRLDYPSRLERILYERKLETVRDLVKVRPAGLLSHRGFGRKTLRAIGSSLTRHIGEGWEEAHLRLGGGPFSDSERSALGTKPPTQIDQILQEPYRALLCAIESLPSALRALPIDEALNPATVRWLRQYGSLLHVADLARLTVLASPRGGAARRAVGDAIEELSKDPLANYATWRALLDSLLDSLPQRSRRIVEEYNGFRGKLSELPEIGKRLGISRQRVHQIDKAATVSLARGAWRVAVRDRLRAAMQGQDTLDLKQLRKRDRFLAVRKTDVRAFAYFVQRLLVMGARVSKGSLSLDPKPSPISSSEKHLAPRRVRPPNRGKEATVGTKTAFVEAIPETVPADEVIAKAKAAGMTLSRAHVYEIRYSARKRRAVDASTADSAPKASRNSSVEIRFRKLALALGVPRSKSIIADVERELYQLINGR